MIKKLILLSALTFQLQNIVANNQNTIGQIPLYESISLEINMTQSFQRICNLISKESMEKFNDLLKDYCYYILTLPDFNQLFNKYEGLYKAYRNFTGKPLTLTIHFAFNEDIDFAKELICLHSFEKTLTDAQKEELNRANNDLMVLINKLLYPSQFSAKTTELRKEIEIELSKCNIPMDAVITDISLF